MEGAEGFVDTSIFSSFPDKKVRQDISDKYIKKGYLTAPEALSIERSTELPFTIYGIEDTKLYLKNFLAFRDTLGDREISDRYIELTNSILNQLKIRTYNKWLFDFDKRANEFSDGTLSLTEWVKVLNNEYNAGKNRDLRYFRLVTRAINLEEGIDFGAVEKERVALLGRLERELPKEELKRLVERSLLFRLGRMSSLEYYKTFEGYHTVHLRRYIHLIKLQSRIDSDRLFDEIEAIEADIREGLYKDKTERELDKVYKDIRILKKLYGLGLTRREVEYFKDNKASFPPSRIVPFITVQAKACGIGVSPELTDKDFLDSAEKVIQPAEYFYELAFERDNVLVENLFKRMEEEDKDKAIIIIGGFHAEGIIKRLIEKGMSYTIISPKITEAQKDNPYIERMMDKRIEIAGLSPIAIMSKLGRRLAGELRREIAVDMLRGREGIDPERLRELFELAGEPPVGRLSKAEIIANINNAIDPLKESLWIEMLRASLALEGKDEAEIDREIAGIINAKRAKTPPPGEMKRLGLRSDPMDEDIRLNLSQRHSEFEALARKETQVREFVGSRVVVVTADGLKAVGAYHFYSNNLGHYIVVLNKNTSQEIQNEGEFHEFRELLWMKNLQAILPREDPGYIQHLAHVIASAEQIKEYAIRDEDANFMSLTPYHQFQVGDMTDAELESIIGEDRTWHHEVLRWAGLDAEAIIAYERRLRDTAAEELLRRRRIPYETHAVNLTKRLRAGTVRPVAGIPDVHGNIDRLNQIVAEIDAMGIRDLVLLGDYIDRDPHSLEVLERMKGLVESKKATALFGNHELMFIMGMLGDDKILFFWLLNGGAEFLKEVGLGIEGWDDKIREAKAAENMMVLHAWLNEKFATEGDRIRQEVRQNETLKYWAEWMLQNLKLYHIDENGTFYVHAGLPVDEDGNILLLYEGKRGRDALDEMEKDLRDPHKRDDVFEYTGKDNAVSVVWLRNWNTGLKDDRAVNNLLRQLGALRIVVGHDVKKTTFLSGRFHGKINFIDFGMASHYQGLGGYFVVGQRGVGIQKFEDRGDTETRQAFNISRDALINELTGTLGGQYLQVTQSPEPGATMELVPPVLDFVTRQELLPLGLTHLIMPNSVSAISNKSSLKLSLGAKTFYILSYEDITILHPTIANNLDPKNRFFLLSYIEHGEDMIGSVTPISVGINNIQGQEAEVIWDGGGQFKVKNLRASGEVSVGLYNVPYPEGRLVGLRAPVDIRGYEGLPNDVYTEGIRDAMARGDFRAVKVGEGFEVLDNLVVALGIQHLLEDTTIYFIPGQKAHYGVGRNQIYLDSALLDNPEKLREQLIHEVIERHSVMQGLRAKGLMDELERTSETPERRSPELRAEIIRLAREAHRRIVDFRPFSDKTLSNEEYSLAIVEFLRETKDWDIIISILNELVVAMGEPQVEFQRLLKERFGISEMESRDIFMLFQELFSGEPIDADFYRLIDGIAGYTGIDGDTLLNIVIKGILQYQLKVEIPLDSHKAEQLLRRKGLWEGIENIRNRRNVVERLESPFTDALMRIRYYHALNEETISPDLAGDREVRQVRANTDFPDAATAEGILPAQRVSEANSLAGGMGEIFGRITSDYTTPAAINIPINSFITNWDELWRILRETKDIRQVISYAPGLASFFNLLKTKGNKNMKVVLRVSGLDEVIEGIGTKGDVIGYLLKKAGVSENVMVGEEIRDSSGLQEERDKLSRKLGIKGENIIFFTRTEELDMEPIRDQVLGNQIKVFGIDENSQLPFLLILGYMASRLDVFRDNRLSDEMARLLSELGLDAEGALFIKIRFIRTAEILEIFRIRKIAVDIAA